MAPVLLLVLLPALLEALLLGPVAFLARLRLPRPGVGLPFLRQRLLRLGGGASLCKLTRRLALAALWVR